MESVNVAAGVLMGGRKLAWLVLCMAVVEWSAGCSREVITSSEWPAPQQQEVRLGPGDQMDVKFRYWPELDQTVTVRPDGKISLQLVDDVEVGGLTPKQADERLTKLYEAELNEPVLTLIVNSINQQKVYVGGEVTKPGVVLMPGKLTVLQAITEAGGFDREHAKMENVLLIRHQEGKRFTRLVDAEQLLTGPEGEDVELAPNDIVYVPRTGISRADQWVDQNINKVIPDLVDNLLLFFIFQAANGSDSGSSN